jgi:hypothetical protein
MISKIFIGHGAERIEQKTIILSCQSFLKACYFTAKLVKAFKYVIKSLIVDYRPFMENDHNIRILKVLRFAMFKKFLNSAFELLPEPSAMLFDIDIPALRNYSANRYNFFSSRLSATSNKIMPVSIDSFHISKSWNLNLAIKLPCCYALPHALCAMRYALFSMLFHPQIPSIKCAKRVHHAKTGYHRTLVVEDKEAENNKQTACQESRNNAEGIEPVSF